MSILNLFNKKPIEKIVSFTLAEHYRGFKAFPMVVHGNEISEQNNQKLKDTNLSGHIITFKYLADRVQVLIDDNQVGTVFDKEHIARISKITAVYARMDEEVVVSSAKTIKRHRIRLFVKEEG